MFPHINHCLLSCRTTLKQARSLVWESTHCVPRPLPCLLALWLWTSYFTSQGTQHPYLWKWEIYLSSEKVWELDLKIMKRSLVNHEVKKALVITVKQDGQWLTPYYGWETKDKIKKPIVPGVTGRKWHSLNKNSGPRLLTHALRWLFGPHHMPYHGKKFCVFLV